MLFLGKWYKECHVFCAQIFSRGMQTEVHMSQDMIDRIFPQLDELIDIHVTFLHSLTERQRCRIDRHIEDISDLLVQQVCSVSFKKK